MPSDEIVLDSPLTVHEATVLLRGLVSEEFGELARVQEAKAGEAVTLRAVRDWSDPRRAFRLQLTLRPAAGGSRVAIVTRSSPGSVLVEAFLAMCACGIVIYKTGWSLWSLLVVAVCLSWLPLHYASVYRAERDRLRPVLLRTLGL